MVEFTRLARALAVAEGHEVAADAVQDAFVSARLRWPYVSRLESPGGWIRRAAINNVKSARSRRVRREEILSTWRPSSSSLDPADRVALESAVSGLPQQQRRSVCLHYLSGYTVEEVARMLGIAPGTVKSHLHDARGTLRSRLGVEADGT